MGFKTVQNDGALNLNRAVCNAAGHAEMAERGTATADTSMMQAVFLEDYVKVRAN